WHDEIGQAILFAIFVDGHDIDMFKFSNEIGLTTETGEKFLVNVAAERDVREEYFDGHGACGAHLSSEVDDTHAALPDMFFQCAGAERFTNEVVIHHRLILLFIKLQYMVKSISFCFSI